MPVSVNAPDMSAYDYCGIIEQVSSDQPRRKARQLFEAILTFVLPRGRSSIYIGHSMRHYFAILKISESSAIFHFMDLPVTMTILSQGRSGFLRLSNQATPSGSEPSVRMVLH